MRPRDARTAYLNGHTQEQAAAIVMKADRLGPGQDDADWLVALAAADAAKRIEAAAPMTEKTLEAIVERLDRIEQRCDDAAKQPPAAIDATMYARLERIEAMLRRGSPAADPFGTVTRYFVVFALGALVCEMVFLAVGNQWIPPMFDRVGMFVLGLSSTAAVLLWLWLAPIVRDLHR